MSKILNKSNCLTNYGLTGKPECPFDLKDIVGVILVPDSFKLTEAQMATEALAKAALQDATLAAIGSRIFPIFRFNGMEDNSEDGVVQTSGYGDRKHGRDGDYIWTFTYWDGAMCLNKQLRKFNYQSHKIMLVDKENQLFGKVIDDELYGFTGQFHAKKMKVANGTDTTVYSCEVNLSNPKELNDTFGVIPFTFDFNSQVKGLLGVSIEVLEATSTYVDFKATMSCGSSDLYDLYEDEMADTDIPLLYTSAGSAVTVTGVTKQSATKSWRAAATLANGTYTIQLAAPSVLAAEGIGTPPASGLESDIVNFTVGS